MPANQLPSPRPRGAPRGASINPPPCPFPVRAGKCPSPLLRGARGASTPLPVPSPLLPAFPCSSLARRATRRVNAHLFSCVLSAFAFPVASHPSFNSETSPPANLNLLAHPARDYHAAWQNKRWQNHLQQNAIPWNKSSGDAITGMNS